jgi:fumarate hydratase subunit beta
VTTTANSLKINVPLSSEDVERLRAGEVVLLTGGTVSTAHDAAHKRMFELLERGETLPVDLKGLGGES